MRALHAPALCLILAAGVACANLPIEFPTGGAGSGGTPAGGSTGSPAQVAAEIVRYTNDARTRNGLAALRASAALMEAARLHAEQMAAHQRGEHTISGARYPTMQSRLQAVGYDYMQAAENVAWNQQSAQAAVSSWMSSSGHRANILDRGLTEMGAAMARSSRGEPYWIQVVGRPR